MKKILKVVSTVALSVCLMISFCACGTPSPTDTVDTFLSAVKAQDQETVKSVYVGKNFSILENIDEEDTDSEDGESTDDPLEKQMQEKVLDFEYTLSNEKINDTKATVDVEFKTYEFGKALTKIMEEYMEKALPLALSGASQEELEKIMNDTIEEEIGALTDKTYTEKTTINLVQKDGVWKVAEIDDEGEVMNAISGNLLNSIKEIDESFGEW